MKPNKAFDTILLDLDGTLLHMDHHKFTMGYFKAFAEAITPLGYSMEQALLGLNTGIEAMQKNNGEQTNQDAFWNVFLSRMGDRKAELDTALDIFYETKFKDLKQYTSLNPLSKKLVDVLRNKGYTVVLATNAVFPKTAILQRIEWAGLDPKDFDLITTYETSHYCKPNPNYFTEIIKTLNKTPETTLMVGNDGREDLGAYHAGMSLYLLEENLIRKEGLEDHPSVEIGSMDALYKQFNVN